MTEKKYLLPKEKKTAKPHRKTAGKASPYPEKSPGFTIILTAGKYF
jgi:hypothetical protein